MSRDKDKIRIDKKYCKGKQTYDNVCNNFTGEWERYQNLGMIERKLLEDYDDKSYIEYKKKNCHDDDLKRKMSQVVGIKKTEYSCNNVTGKWKRHSGKKYILNPKLEKFNIPDIPSNIYNFYKMKKRSEYLKDPLKCGISKGKKVVLKKYLDDVAREWSEIKKEHGKKFDNILDEYEGLIKKRDKILSDNNLDLYIPIDVIEMGRLRPGEYNGFSFFNHENNPTKTPMTLIKKTKLNKELWGKMSIEEKNKWAKKALEYNKTVLAGQTENELLAAKNITENISPKDVKGKEDSLQIIVSPNKSFNIKTKTLTKPITSKGNNKKIPSYKTEVNKSKSKAIVSFNKRNSKTKKDTISKSKSKPKSKKISKKIQTDYELEELIEEELKDKASEFFIFKSYLENLLGTKLLLNEKNVQQYITLFYKYNELNKQEQVKLMEDFIDSLKNKTITINKVPASLNKLIQ